MSNTIKSIPQTSFINLFPEIVYDKNQIPSKSLDIWNAFRIGFLSQSDSAKIFTYYRPNENDSVYSLALNFYNDPQLWWLILLVNDAEDPFLFITDTIEKQKSIKILKLDFIPSLLTEMRKVKSFNDSITQGNNNA